jgi:hypothetical protein
MPRNRERARQQWAYRPRCVVSTHPLPCFGRANYRKSPADAANIPVFGRRWSETWFVLAITRIALHDWSENRALHSGSPAFRNPSANVARSSGRGPSSVATAVQELAREKKFVFTIAGGFASKLTGPSCAATSFQFIPDTYALSTAPTRAVVAKGLDLTERETVRPADPGADQGRIGDQPQSRQAAWFDRARQSAGDADEVIKVREFAAAHEPGCGPKQT